MRDDETPLTDSVIDAGAQSAARVGKTGEARVAVLYGYLLEHARQMEKDRARAVQLLRGLCNSERTTDLLIALSEARAFLREVEGK